MKRQRDSNLLKKIQEKNKTGGTKVSESKSRKRSKSEDDGTSNDQNVASNAVVLSNNECKPKRNSRNHQSAPTKEVTTNDTNSSDEIGNQEGTEVTSNPQGIQKSKELGAETSINNNDNSINAKNSSVNSANESSSLKPQSKVSHLSYCE